MKSLNHLLIKKHNYNNYDYYIFENLQENFISGINFSVFDKKKKILK